MSVAVYEKSTTTFTRATRPSFPGVVRGEIFKQTRSRPVWGLALLVLVTAALPALFLDIRPRHEDSTVWTYARHLLLHRDER